MCYKWQNPSIYIFMLINKVWTSWMKRTIQTAQFIKGNIISTEAPDTVIKYILYIIIDYLIKDAPQERWKALNEIDAVIISIFLKTVFYFKLIKEDLKNMLIHFYT